PSTRLYPHPHHPQSNRTSTHHLLPLTPLRYSIFFFNATAPTEIYTLSLHDALPISCASSPRSWASRRCRSTTTSPARRTYSTARSEEHTSELQSRSDLVCRLLLEKKKNTDKQLQIAQYKARLTIIPREYHMRSTHVA